MAECKFRKHSINTTPIVICTNPKINAEADGQYVICMFDEFSNLDDQTSCPKAEFEVDLVKENDHVNHPNHYCQGGIECIKAIEASMPPDGFQDYCKGNVLKYIWRWRDKAGVEDLKKAKVYLEWLIESAEKSENGTE